MNLPDKLFEHHLVILGKTGAGKSSALRLMVEGLLSRKRRVCVIDPKGDWWGLKVSADGKGPGFPAILFGDFKEPNEPNVSDVPVNDRSGKTIAELIASGNRPAVIGMRGWFPAAQSRFWIDFASTVFNSNSAGGLHLVIDEVQNFGPKERSGFGEENMALYWTKKLLSEGRGLGLSIFVGSQRPQSVHNGVLTQCETLVGMRVTHNADCVAVEDWLKRTGDKERRAEIMTTIPQLARGAAWVWCPEVKFGPERIVFPMFSTFDSFAPPQKQKRIDRKGWASVDLDEVKEKLASAIEEHKANDPVELRKEITRLEKENRARGAQIANLEGEIAEAHNRSVKEKAKEIPTLSRSQIRALNNLVSRSEQLVNWSKTASEKVEDVKRETTILKERVFSLNATIRAPSDAAALGAARPAMMEKIKTILSRPSPTATSTSLTPSDNGELRGGMRAILTVAAQYHPNAVSDEQISVLTGYKKTSRGVFKQKLFSAGYITKHGDGIFATTQGIEALGEFERLPEGDALRGYWLNRLTGGELKLFQVYVANYPNAVSAEQMKTLTLYEKTSIGVYRQKLRARKLVVGDAASPELFK